MISFAQSCHMLKTEEFDPNNLWAKYFKPPTKVILTTN